MYIKAGACYIRPDKFRQQEKGGGLRNCIRMWYMINSRNCLGGKFSLSGSGK